MSIHVNDVLCTNHNHFVESLMSKLQDNFVVRRMETKCFKHLGLNIKHEENNLTLIQKNYVDNLTKIDIEIDQRKNQTLLPITPEKEVPQSKIDQLLWLCNQTRPDFSFRISNLASNLKTAAIHELIQCNKTISKVKDIYLKLQYKKLQGNLKLVVYTNASFCNLTDGSSQGAYLIFLVGNNS